MEAWWRGGTWTWTCPESWSECSCSNPRILNSSSSLNQSSSINPLIAPSNQSIPGSEYLYSTQRSGGLWSSPMDSLSSSEYRIGYCHSSPLLNARTLRAIPAVDTVEEMEEIKSILKASNLRLRFCAVVATVYNFSKLLSKGCHVLHYVSFS